jgi:hypothetical protein
MLKVSHIAMIATLAIGLAAIMAPTAASAQCSPTVGVAGCVPPPGGGDPGEDIPDPGEPGGNEPFDEGGPDGGDDPGDGPGDEGGPDDGDEPGDGGDPGEGGPGGGGPGGDPGPDGIPGTGDEPKLVVALDCAIKDEQARTTDLWLVNVGTADLEAGLKIRYNIPATGDQGAFYLPKTIKVGKEGRLSDSISEIPVGEECRVEIIA